MCTALNLIEQGNTDYEFYFTKARQAFINLIPPIGFILFLVQSLPTFVEHLDIYA